MVITDHDGGCCGAVLPRYSDGEFADLSPDKYIHTRLLAHADKANMTHLLAHLLSNLGWLAACVRYWDPNSLMGAYKKYRQHLPESANQFQLFLSAHLDVLATRPSLQDVIQLALNNPDAQALYGQALALARKDKDTLWLTWCNASSIFRPTDLIQLQPHKTDAHNCQYYSNGSKVASCSSMTIKLWEASTGKVLHTFSGHNDHITDCVISEDERIIISSSDDGTCNVWEVGSRKLLLQFTEHNDGVQCCDLSPDTSLVVSADIGAEVILWHTTSGDVRAKWRHGDAGITSCKFTPSGDAVVVANQDGVLKMWNLHGSVVASFSLNYTPSSPGASFDFSFSHSASRSTSGVPSDGSNGPTFTVKGCVFSRDGIMMVAAVGNCTARVWSVETSECIHIYKHSSDVLSVDISSDGKLLVAGCLAGNVKVWSLSEGRPVLDIPLHYDWVQCVEFSPDNSRILSSSSGSIKMIKRDSSKQSGKIYRRRYSVHYSQRDRGYTPIIVCFDMRQKQLEVCQGLEAMPTHMLSTIPGKNPRSWNISPDALHVIVGYDTGHLQLLELSTGKEVWLTENAHTSKITHCYFSPDGNRIVSCGESDRHHQAWSRANGKLLSSQANCQNYLVRPCVWYNDSVCIASTVPGQVMVWDSTTGKELFRCKGISDNLDESILCVNISKDNSKLIASASIGRVAVWDASDGSLLFTGDNNSSARYCSLNDNGSIAAVGYDDCTLKIFNIARGSEIQTPQNASLAWMIYTGFSPDGRQILTLSNSIEWWSTEGKLIKRFLLKNTFGKYLMFSPDFKIFITIDNTGLLYVLSVLEDH